MSLPTVSAAAYRRVTLAAVVALAAVVVTGGAVRLTGSGLGCPTWPRCTAHSYAAKLSFHPLVEFGNRMISLAVFAVIAAAVAGAVLRTPRRGDLLRLSLGLVAGYLAQAVIGGLTVLFHLTPPLVMAHFLVSMVLLWNAVTLHVRAGTPPTPARPLVAREIRWLAYGVLSTAAAILVLGTVVTGAGPHSGAAAVDRLPVSQRDAAQLHSDIVMLAVGLTAALAVTLRLVGAPPTARRRVALLLAVMAAQATVGFVQYFLGSPRLLVLVHVAGATVFWLATLGVVTALYERPPAPAQADPAGAGRRERPQRVRAGA